MLKDSWLKTKEQLSASLPGTKKRWLDNAEYVSEDNDSIKLSFSSQFYKDNFDKQCKTEVENTISEFEDRHIRCTFSIDKDRAKEKAENVPEKKEEIKQETKKNETLNPSYLFDNFIIGENNLFAANVARVIAKNPGTSYNPCLIYGGVGLGKTHLIQAIGNYIYSHNPKMKVIYVTAETFTNELIHAISAKTANNKFKQKYRSADVLLIDDIHFLSGKESTQEEIFHTFNELTDKNKQVVFTCDRPISELVGINERLITRFRKGTNVDLQPPKYETRMAIAKKKCQTLNFNLSDQVLEFVCQNINTNVRDLEGAITTLQAFSNLVGKEITKEIAAEHIKNFIPVQMIKNNDISIDQIIRETSRYFSISEYEIKGKSRNKTVTIARHIAMYLASTLTNLSLSEIGNFFNGKDHTTVVYAIKKIESAEENDESLKEAINKIKESF
ncbi:MAG TPA: chromosomal replication initiator protein DnaA [Candidatus Ornithospirochaeta avicola]|uniref:Chromosomal replication initiator protein DnaA n=1 Tax=Candidatus Ornithospirochaeta avicola TaxID=2840896 RepID=A0A9D1PTY8_9SPIO|nr:chromosomal replication initiator protein DnaA [Candidatus Ornithospirochaeta avicola]